MFTDLQGNTLSGATAETVDLYNQAMRAFNIYRGDPVGLLDEAAQTAPEFAMAYIAKAHLFVTTSEPEAIDGARTLIGTAKTLPLNEREGSHVAALEWLFEGEWSQAALALDRHNIQFPHDLLALQSGHLIDFYRASARNLRDRIARVLPNWSSDIPGYSILLGMYAFGLEECGDYRRAEDLGRQAVAIQPLDCWAHHAVTHVMEMRGRAEDGIGWMISREPYWSGDDNSFKVHNWWHRALFHLDLGLKDEALALYDGPIREDRSTFALDLVDASALLWRLQLSGLDVGDRWQEVANRWSPLSDGHTYPFSDWHAVMAYLGAGRDQDVERIIAALRESAAASAEINQWARTYGLPLAEGFTAFWRGDYETATERLYRVRFISNAFGGSHAQRDVIDWTLTEAALRGGYKALAQALANERLALKPYSRVNSEFLARSVKGSAATQQAA